MKIYLSKQGYDKKPDKSSGIIKCVNSYNLVDIDLETLYKKLIDGHFIHHECGYNESNNGSKYYTFKKTLLKQTQVMCIDLDYKLKETKPSGKIIEKHYETNEMPEWNDVMLSDLSYTNSLGQKIDISPTFWMESFSAHKITDKKIVGNSVHLFYVFEDPIYNVVDFKKAALSIMIAIYNALKHKGYDIPLERDRNPFDPVSYDMFQGLWGSYGKASGYNGNTYFWDVFVNSFKDEYKTFMFPWKDDTEELNDDDIRRTIKAYSEVKSIDDIDISKSQYIKYKEYFGHEEGFHIISVLKHEYAIIEGKDAINSRQSLCYQICKKLLLGHCNDFFDNDEHNFYHEYKRCKIYNKKGTNEAAYMSHAIKLIGDTGALPLIEYKDKTNKYKNTIYLDKNEYLSDKREDIIKLLDNDKINFIIADPGLGKTVFAKSFEGNTLIIELFNSIISSEEKFSSIEFTKFKEDKYINNQLDNRLNVCSANKFNFWYENKDKGYFNSFIDDDKCLFDNIILDESHLLCLSNFRYDIMGDTIKYLKKLKYEYPDTNIIIMTGTPFGETSVFDSLNIIKIVAEPRYVKKFFMIQTTSIEGYMHELIKDSLKKGLRIFIPVDSENWFDTFIDSCFEDGIIDKDKTFYFNQPKNAEEIEKSILNTKLIGDIKILGTSSYMSVGIDLEDWKTEFITIIPSGASMTGNFSGIEVDQFANRHRKQNLEVHYVISMDENNNKKPILTSSYRVLLNIKNELLIKMYRTNPIIIKMPQYLINSDNDRLEVHEDRFNSFVYYKDMKPIISHPMVIYEYMEKGGWICEWKKVEHVERGINTKEHKDEEKKVAVSEFVELLKTWSGCFYPIIKTKNSISQEFNIIKHNSKQSLFDVDYIEVDFTTYYAKNSLFGMLLHLREYLTGEGAYRLIMDAYNGEKINMSFIQRNLLAIKLINNYNRTGLWDIMHDKLKDFYSDYSSVDNGVYKDNKKEFEAKRDKVVQSIWDEISKQIDDDILQLAFKTNYDNVTESLIDNFMEGVKLVQEMYLEKKTKQKKIQGKNYKVNTYHWDSKKLSKYELRKDKEK